MKKLTKILLLTFLGLLLISCGKKVTEEEAREVLKYHLQERYGEPFEVGSMRLKGVNGKVYFQGEIMPSKYLGTAKERDSYYSSYGTVRIYKNLFGEKLGTGGDVYMGVNLNENAAEFFKPKLDELFDELYIPVFDIDVWTVKNNGDFKDTLQYHKEGKEKRPFYIKGYIYAFGRIESEEDVEKYRKKIFEYIQFMKETGTFDTVGFWITIDDERVLSDEFVENKEDQEELLNLKKDENGIKRRAEIMSKYSESFEKTSKENKLKRIETYGKNPRTFREKIFYNDFLAVPIYSIGYIKEWGLNNTEKREYLSYEEIIFEEEFYYDFIKERSIIKKK